MLDKIKFFLKRPLRFPIVIITKLPFFDFIRETGDYQAKVNFEYWFKQKVLNWGGNKAAYWPVHWTSKVYNADKITVGVDAYPGYNGGAYITGVGGLEIGNYCVFAKNIVIVTANHSLYDSRIHIPQPVKIGDYCWMGAGAKIMPGVVLGDYTIVAAGCVVTKSFSEGYCVLAGVPAKVIKKLDADQCVKYEHKKKYYGYLSARKFELRNKKLQLTK